MRRRNGSCGSVLILALLLVGGVMAAIYGLVQRSQETTRISTDFKMKERNNAFVQNGIEYGLWRIRRDREEYDLLKAGGVLDKLDGVFTFSDTTDNMGTYLGYKEYGEYTILVATGPEAHQITIVSEGWVVGHMDQKTRIEAVYQDVSLTAPLVVEADPLKVNLAVQYALIAAGGAEGAAVHWGPMMVRRGIEVTDYALAFPRKIAKWRINGRDNGSETIANSDLKEYWAHSNQFLARPNFSVDIMRQNAQDFVFGATTDPYFPPPGGGGDIMITSLFEQGDKPWFFDGNLKLQGQTFLQGTIVVNGDLLIQDPANGGNQAGWMDDTPIPEGAQKEYLNAGGYPVGSAFDVDPNATAYSFPNGTVGMRGFVYVLGDLIVNKNGGGNIFYIYGGVYVKGKADLGDRSTFRIYAGDFKNDALPWPVIDTPVFQLVSKSKRFLKN